MGILLVLGAFVGENFVVSMHYFLQDVLDTMDGGDKVEKAGAPW